MKRLAILASGFWPPLQASNVEAIRARPLQPAGSSGTGATASGTRSTGSGTGGSTMTGSTAGEGRGGANSTTTGGGGSGPVAGGGGTGELAGMAVRPAAPLVVSAGSLVAAGPVPVDRVVDLAVRTGEVARRGSPPLAMIAQSPGSSASTPTQTACAPKTCGHVSDEGQRTNQA